MNQRADSRKINLALIVTGPLKDRNGWLLSHTGNNEALSSFAKPLRATAGSRMKRTELNDADMAQHARWRERRPAKIRSVQLASAL